jgi:hypothetical protein
MIEIQFLDRLDGVVNSITDEKEIGELFDVTGPMLEKDFALQLASNHMFFTYIGIRYQYKSVHIDNEKKNSKMTITYKSL